MLSLQKHLPEKAQNILRKLRKNAQPPLYKRLPLPQPLSLHIDPSNLCNFQCVFCPTGDRALLASVNRFQGVMPLKLFRKIIDDCAAMTRHCGRKLQQVHLYKDGEPLMNKNFTAMAAYAKEKKIARNLSTTTNGSLLTEEIARELIGSGIDTIRISIERGDDEGYKKITRTFDDFEGLRSKVAFLYREKKRKGSPLRIVIKINDFALSMEEKRKFFHQFRPICDAIKIDTLMGWSSSEKKDFTLGVPVKTAMDGVTSLRDRLICPQPFSALAINPNGSASICCVDWAYATVVGSAADQTILEIWQGEQLRQFRLTHAQGKRSELPACAACQYIRGFPDSESLDEHVETVLKTVREGLGAHE